MTTQQPPGWHPDPQRRHQLRYWNGSEWTDDVATGATQGKDPLSAAPPTTYQTAAAYQGAPPAATPLVAERRRRKWPWVLAGIFVVITAIGAFADPETHPASTTETTTTVSPATEVGLSLADLRAKYDHCYETGSYVTCDRSDGTLHQFRMENGAVAEASGNGPTTTTEREEAPAPEADDEPCTTTNFGSYGKVTVYHRCQSDEFVVPGGPSAPVCNP